MKFTKMVTFLTTISILTLTLAACGQGSASSGTEEKEASKLMAVGSTALQPLVEQAATDFQAKNKNVTITVQGGGSGTGLSQVQAGAVTIGNSDVFAEQKDGIDASKLVDHQVAVVGFAPVTNPDVTVKNLTKDQLKQIFTGKIKNWQEVGGKDEAINVINRAEGSGTRASFEAAVLDGEEAVKSQEQDSNGTVKKIVASTPGAISYLAFSYLDDELNTLAIDGVKPTEENVATDDWKIWSYEHMYTKGEPKDAAKEFLDYVKSDEVQKNLVKKLGYISISSMQVQKDAENNVTAK